MTAQRPGSGLHFAVGLVLLAYMWALLFIVPLVCERQ